MNSLTFAHTTGSGTNRLMLVGVTIANDANTQYDVTEVTYGLTPLTFIGRVMAPTGGGGTPNTRPQTEIWALASPASGTANVVVSLGGVRAFMAGVTTFSGVDLTSDLTSALGAYNSASASSGTDASVAVTSLAGQVVYDVVASSQYSSNYPSIFTAGAGQTEQWTQNTRSEDGTNDNRIRGAGSTETASDLTTTMNWTLVESLPWSIGAVPIIPLSNPARNWTCPGGDQTGLLLYTLTPGVTLAAAWGQDPLAATAGSPGLDVGTSIPPMPLFTSGKNATLYDDNNGDGFISVGDELEYTIVVFNISRAPIPNLILTDSVPANTTYVANSTYNGATQVPDSGATPFPLDEGGANLGTLALHSSFTVTFRVLINTPLPGGTTVILNCGTAAAMSFTIPFCDVTYIGGIGDFVWFDVDMDGIQDAGEAGIPGVVVNLLTSSGTLVASTFTNMNGWYGFTGFSTGNYMVEFIKPTGFSPSPQDQGVDDALDSDADTVTGRTAVFTWNAGETNTTYDAGFWLPQDWGDLPDPTYAALAASNGPRHRLYPDTNADGLPNSLFTDPAIWLGPLVDSELNGQPNATATGDGADEDGVEITDVIPGMGYGSMDITFYSSEPDVAKNACLAAWFDTNGDGDLIDVGETNTYDVSWTGTSTQSFNFNLIATLPEWLFYRVRLYDAPSCTAISPTSVGQAINGEVED